MKITQKTYVRKPEQSALIQSLLLQHREIIKLGRPTLSTINTYINSISVPIHTFDKEILKWLLSLGFQSSEIDLMSRGESNNESCDLIHLLETCLCLLCTHVEEKERE